MINPMYGIRIDPIYGMISVTPVIESEIEIKLELVLDRNTWIQEIKSNYRKNKRKRRRCGKSRGRR